jgi:hypothetical protein
VLRQAGRIVTIGALCCAIGLHWVAIQSFAWTNMIIQYSKGASFCQAVAQTFDGDHPCSLCHIVTSGKASEKKADMQSVAPKIDIICVERAIQLVSAFAPIQFVIRDFSVFKIEQSPPVPPPRAIAT